MRFGTQAMRKVLNYPAKAGRLPHGANKFMGKTYMKKGPLGIGKGAFYASGVASSVYLTDYTDRYGTGFAVLHGLAATAPYSGALIFAGEVGIGAMEYGYSKYHQRRKLNMSRPMVDSYGTMNAMKMNSLHKMQRGHNSIQNTMGNEARYLHR